MAWSLATIALGTAIAGTGVQVAEGIKSGQAQKAAGKAENAAAESQAELQDYNATLADQQAADALAQGDVQSNDFRTQVRGMIGRQRSLSAGSNVDVSFGSAADVQADAAKLGELDALQIKTNAARTAWGYQVNAADLRKSAEITRKTGVAAADAANARGNAAYVGAAGAGLLGTASLLEKRYGK